MMLEKLKANLESSPIIKKGDYDYFINPITDGVPFMEPAVLREVIDAMLKVGDFQCDFILAPEAMGIPLVVPLSLHLDIPYSVIRKRRYYLPGEAVAHQVTGYSQSDLFINGLKAGDRVVLVDDVISTGGTMRAIVRTLQGMGVKIVDIIVAVEKGENRHLIEAELNVKIKTLVKVEVRQGKVVII